MHILKKRSDFLKAAKGLKYVSRGFVLQSIKHHENVEQNIRIGFTASKKVGNAVKRNRAKRRLRALARDVALKYASNGFDYVFVARKNILNMDYAALEQEVAKATKHLERARNKLK